MGKAELKQDLKLLGCEITDNEKNFVVYPTKGGSIRGDIIDIGSGAINVKNYGFKVSKILCGGAFCLEPC